MLHDYACVPVKLRCLPMTRWHSKKIVLVSRPRPAVTLASTLGIFPPGQHRTMWTLMQRSQLILLLDRSHHRQLASSWTALRYQECSVMSTWASLLHLICAGMTMLPLYWRKLHLHYTCLLPSPIVISYLQQLFGNSTLRLYDHTWSSAMLCGVARQPGLWSHWKRLSSKSQEPLFTRNVGNRVLRCFVSVTFRPLRGGGESIVCVSCTFCTKAKVHRRYLSFFRQPFKLEQK